MDQNNITPRLKTVLKNAKKESIKRGNTTVGIEHVTIAIIDADCGIASSVLKKTTIPFEKIKESIGKYIPKVEVKEDEVRVFDKVLEKVLVDAKEIAEKFKHTYIGTEHVLIAILCVEDGNVFKAFKDLSMDPVGIRTQLDDEMTSATSKPESLEKIPAGGAKKEEEKTNAGESFIKKYAIDLVEKASEGKLDPVIGREKEVARVIAILSRKKKNNPVLVGPAGVGKTSVVEGLALRIFEKRVPFQLLNKRVFALDMAQIVAGTMYRGQFEDRIKKILKEAKDNKDYILFIDELHTVVGAGSAEGTMDASNMFKPALARGELNCVGATTEEEHRRYIERDAALERRFQIVKTLQPSVEDTKLILKGAASSYESFHGVRYGDEVVEAIVTLSDRLIKDRNQPDKSFDILDEAGARVKLTLTEPYQNRKELEQKLASTRVEHGKAITANDTEAMTKLSQSIDEIEKNLVTAKAQEEKLVVKLSDVYAVVSGWTGVPVGDLGISEKNTLLNIEETLNGIVIGQEDAVMHVAKSVKKYRTPLRSLNRPIGSFMFCGPTGVGKTLLAKTITKKMFGSDEALLALDMSEYADSTAVTKLVGSSAGYVGYDDGAKLCKFVQRKPFSVILFDEIEKAHPDVIQVLLQIFEEGRLTDNHGKIVDFKNTIVILTSNVGTQAAKAMGFGSDEDVVNRTKNNVETELKRYFKPEFLNRLQVINFSPMTKDNALKVIELEIAELNKKLESEKITIQLTAAASNFILKNGFDEKFGARNIRRQIEIHIEDALTNDFLAEKFSKNSVIIFDVTGDKLTHLEVISRAVVVHGQKEP